MQVLVHFRLRGILIKLLRLVSTVRHQETTDRPHHARQQLVQCLLQAHLHAPQQYSYQLTQAWADRQQLPRLQPQPAQFRIYAAGLASVGGDCGPPLQLRCPGYTAQAGTAPARVTRQGSSQAAYALDTNNSTDLCCS